MVKGTILEKEPFYPVARFTNSKLLMKEPIFLGINLGFKVPLENKFIKYSEIATGFILRRWESDLDLEYYVGNKDYDTTNLNVIIAGIAPSLGFLIHTRPILRHFAFCGGLEASAFLGKYGTKSEGNTLKNQKLGYTIGSDYLIATPLGIKYNASCDLNIELYYQPYWMFNFETEPESNLIFFQSFRVLLRYKLYQKPIDDSNKRTDMFF